MKITQNQLDQIIETILENADNEIEVTGYREYDNHLSIPEKVIAKVKADIEDTLGNGDLQMLFNIQRKLQAKIDFNDMSLIQYIRLMFIGIVTEACEALEKTDWKPWKKSTGINPVQSELFKKEIVDIWHFVINLTMASGMNPKELVKRYVDKNSINNIRQDEGY